MIFDPLELNYSKIRAYLDCPFLYRYIYVERRFQPPTAPSSLGLSVHRALARFHAAGGRGDLGSLMNHYEDCWLHQGYATPQAMMEFYKKGAAVLEAWWTHWQANRAEVLFSERPFEFLFEKWKIKGTIDRVDRLPGGTVELIDYKMGFEGKTAADVADSLQLSLYAVALGRAFDLKVASLGYFVLTETKKITIPYDPATGEATMALVRETGDRMLMLDMYRKGNCARCPIREHCAESEARTAA